MKKLISIGEILIDFIPQEKGVMLSNVANFERVAGGAPANVTACVSLLGNPAIILSKLGKDAFGDYLIQELDRVNVNTNYIKRTSQANTGLAFVSLDENGNRDFSFYRNPSADMLLNEQEIPQDIFNDGDVLHFCSVDLIDAPVKKAHKKAISYALRNNCFISFDPNVRLPLWEDHLDLKNTILEFIPYAHILKISDEELEFITGCTNIEKALPKLFIGNVKIVVYTKGPNGCELYTIHRSFKHNGFKVDTVDTTGSGDSFIGALIFQLLQSNKMIENVSKLDFEHVIVFANAVGAIVASKKGGIPSMPTLKEVNEFIENS